MESIAAERLNKIGKNPSLVSQREDLQSDLKAVSELITMSILENDQEGGDASYCDPFEKKGLPRPKSESCFKIMTDFTSSRNRGTTSPTDSTTPTVRTTLLDPQETAKSEVKESKSTFNLHSLLH